jgi:hypothetical protein
MKILLFGLVLLTSFVHANDSVLKICLTGSTEKALPKYGEAFVNGAQLAINDLESKDKNRVKLEVHYYDSNPLAPIYKLDEMKSAACDAIIGFSTGNDLIAVEDNLKKDPVFTLSIYGDPQPRFNETTYLRTMQPSASDLVDHLFLNLPFKIQKDAKLLVITAADRSEMISYKAAYLTKLKDLTKKITEVEVIEQTHDLSKLEETLKSKWDYVVLLTRSLVAAEISDRIQSDSGTIILGTKYFGSSELPAFYNFLKNKKVQVFFTRQNCSCDSSLNYQKLKEKYTSTYKDNPMSISIDSYDATKFILQSLKAKALNSKSVITYLNSKDAGFNGVSSLNITEALKLKTTKRFLIKIDESGYNEVK